MTTATGSCSALPTGPGCAGHLSPGGLGWSSPHSPSGGGVGRHVPAALPLIPVAGAHVRAAAACNVRSRCVVEDRPGPGRTSGPTRRPRYHGGSGFGCGDVQAAIFAIAIGIILVIRGRPRWAPVAAAGGATAALAVGAQTGGARLGGVIDDGRFQVYWQRFTRLRRRGRARGSLPAYVHKCRGFLASCPTCFWSPLSFSCCWVSSSLAVLVRPLSLLPLRL